MADEPKKDHPEDIESILSDLDAILTDMGGEAPPKPAPVEPPKPEPVKAAAPKPVEPSPPPPKPAEPPPPPKAVEPPPAPKAAEPPPPSIELAPREGVILPPAKKSEPPKPAAKLPESHPPIELSTASAAPAQTPPPPPPAKPVEPPKAVEPPKPAAAPAAAPPPPSPTAASAPGPVVPSTKIEPLPADAPKEQIRRVAYVYTFSCAEVKGACAAFLSQAARTISKKPIFLREVLAHEVTATSDPNALLQKALQVKAVAILAIVEGWPPAKVDELSEACSRANMLFRAVAPGDAQKKSTAVDIIVDMMLLPGES